MKRILVALYLSIAPLSAAGLAVAQTPPPPTSALDGDWRGRSDGGSCNAPLDYVIRIENGFVDGSAYDTTAHGPVPNLKKAPPPAPTPGLWQIHGLVRPGGSFPLITVASVTGSDRREGTLTARVEGSSLLISENGGCRRTVRLIRG
ncbi:MAG: hypothetical protein ACOY4R_00395 [Pseudomonadota bacterium]